MAQGPDWERVQSMLDDFLHANRTLAGECTTARRRELSAFS